MNILYIDTSDNKRTVVRLLVDKKEYKQESSSRTPRAESAILLIDKIVQEGGITTDNIDEIKVKRGPGSYTGLKVGVSIANALSFSLQKSVNGKKLGEAETPLYTS